MPPISTLLADTFGVLLFRRPSPWMAKSWPWYLAFGLLMTWLAGIGRYWDNPRAETWQYWGLGSVAYVFCLALILWALLAPLRPRRWSYRNVLIFLTLTAPPALLYAIPVEQFMSLHAAQATNAWFLAIVATWRVALLAWYLHSVAGMPMGRIVIATLLPLALIVVVLAMLNLEHVVFNIMAGMRPEDRSPNDTAYGVVAMLAIGSFVMAPFLAGAYLYAVYQAWNSTDTQDESSH